MYMYDTRSHSYKERKKPVLVYFIECVTPNGCCTDLHVSILINVSWSVQTLPFQVEDCVRVIPLSHYSSLSPIPGRTRTLPHPPQHSLSVETFIFRKKHTVYF